MRLQARDPKEPMCWSRRGKEAVQTPGPSAMAGGLVFPSQQQTGGAGRQFLLEHEATVQELSTRPGLQEVLRKPRQGILGHPFSAQSPGVCRHTLQSILAGIPGPRTYLSFLRCVWVAV